MRKLRPGRLGDSLCLPKPLRAKPGQRTWSSDFRDLFTGPLWSSLLAKWLSLLSLPHSPVQSDWGRKLIVSAGLLPHGLLQKEPPGASRALRGLLPFLRLFASLPVWTHSHAEVVLCIFPNTQYFMFCPCCSSPFWIQLLEFYFRTCSYYLTWKLLGV